MEVQIAIVVALLFLLLAAGTHIGIALAVSGFIGTLFVMGFSPAIATAVTAIYHKITNPVLITLPLFTLMGYLAAAGGISRHLYDSLSLWLGKVRGGLGMATVFCCTAFGTVCGSSVITTAVFTKISAPEMRRHGYAKQIAYALCASAGSIGMLIPPSVLAIVYSMMSGESLAKVLMAGVMPGLLWAGAFCLTVVVIGKVKPSWVPLSQGGTATWGQRLASLKLWWPILVVAISIFGGIYGGVFTPTEAAAIASLVLIAIFSLTRIIARTRREQRESLGELKSILNDTATTSGMIFLVMGAATIFSNFVALSGVTSKVSGIVIGLGLSKLGLVLTFAGVYLVLGCFLDSISMLCITVPIFNPIIKAAGVDPMWYATIVITSVEIGLITPPVGLNLYASKAVAESDVTLEDIIAGILPFLAAEFVCLALMFAFPPMCTFLPGLLK